MQHQRRRRRFQPLPGQPAFLPDPAGIVPLPDMQITASWNDQHALNDVWISGTYTIAPPLCYTHCHNFVDSAQFFEHYMGWRWKIIPAPSADDYTAYMPYATAGTSPRDIWAVGDFNDSNLATNALIEHWNGSTWSTENPGFSFSDEAEFHHVYAFSPKLVYAVGLYSVFPSSYPSLLIDKFNGSVWSNIPFSGEATFLSLQRKANHITIDVQYPTGQIATVIIDTLK